MGGVYAISFADFFYEQDGSTGTGSFILRGVAVIIGIYGIYAYRKKQNQCSIDPNRKRKKFNHIESDNTNFRSRSFFHIRKMVFLVF